MTLGYGYTTLFLYRKHLYELNSFPERMLNIIIINGFWNGQESTAINLNQYDIKIFQSNSRLPFIVCIKT